MTDFYSRNDVNYNGDVYSIPFPYIKEKEVQVFLDDTLFEDWFFLNDSQIKLRNIPQEVTSNTIVSVRRITDIDKKVVTYTNNTLLNKENLNLSQDQLLFAVQEIYDNNVQFQSDIREEVDEKVERVSDAVEQLEALNDAVETAVNASLIAEEKAEFVTQKEEAINQTIDHATQEIETTSQTVLDEIEQQAAFEKAEIDSLSGDLKESIKDLKVLTTLEIGDIGFTQMAIDETKGKRRILNGQLIIQEQYAQFVNIIKNSVALNPDLACAEAEWQTELTMSANGVCYKYVIDDEAGTIRLPKYPEYLDLSINTGAVSQTVSVYGNGYSLGLTTDGSNYQTMAHKKPYGLVPTSTAYSKLPKTASGEVSYNNQLYGITTNASKSGLTGKVTVPAVESEKIKGTYFIQVATGAETEDNIINEIELNNPFSLLDYKYSEYELNNLSWLRSEGQYNSKAIYPAVYDLLLKIYNGTETKAGVSVKLSTEEYTDYDFVLNTADETFRLPVKVKQKFFTGGDVPVVGNGMTLGLTNGTQNGGLFLTGNGGGALVPAVNAYGDSISSGNSLSPIYNIPSIVGVSTDATKSGIVAKITQTEVSGLYLYFYVGETVQNANLVNIGRIQETYTTKSMVDGQWVGNNYTIASSTSFAADKSVTYDLSSYLPNDGYTYEVLFSLQAQTGGTSGYAVNLSLGTDITPGFIIAKAITRANAGISCVGSATVPVGTARQVTLKQWVSYPCAIISFDAVGYRRIGTNL